MKIIVDCSRCGKEMWHHGPPAAKYFCETVRCEKEAARHLSPNESRTATEQNTYKEAPAMSKTTSDYIPAPYLDGCCLDQVSSEAADRCEAEVARTHVELETRDCDKRASMTLNEIYQHGRITEVVRLTIDSEMNGHTAELTVTPEELQDIGHWIVRAADDISSSLRRPLVRDHDEIEQRVRAEAGEPA